MRKQYKITIKGKKFSMEADKLSFAQALARAHYKTTGENVEIREKRGSRWYLIETIGGEK